MSDDVKTKTMTELKKWFVYDPATVTISDQGVVDVRGSVSMKGVYNKPSLPVEFGTATFFIIPANVRLQTLQGCPQKIFWDFDIEVRSEPRNIPNLIGGPKWVGGLYRAAECGLNTLEGCPEHVGGIFDITENDLTSLHSVPNYCDIFAISVGENLGLLKLCLLFCNNLQIYRPNGDPNRPLTAILRRYLNTGRDGIVPCAAELHKAGFSGNAKL
jgi:hypothetical protein